LVTCAVIFAAALPDVVRYLGCVLFSLSVGVLPGSIMSASQSHARTPAQVGTVQGMIMQGSNLGQFLSPLLVATVVSRVPHGTLDWSRMLYLLMASALLIIACGQWLRRIELHLVASR
ncbi:MAG: hypothetical protein OEY03_09230, partial [Rhizobacter sp.]|nr:hypothetical protein [Rhizobacter sp.]